MIMSFNMIQIWNSRIACNDGIACLLWAFSTDFRVLWVSPLSWRSAEDPHALLSCQTTSPLHFPLQGLDKVALLHTLQDFHGTGQCPAFRGLERQMTPMAVSSVRPVVFTGPPRAPSCFSPPRWRGALSRSAAAALSPARQRRRFGSLSGCGDSAFSTAAVILLAWRRGLLGGGGGGASIRLAAACPVWCGGIAFATVANLCISGLALGFVGRP